MFKRDGNALFLILIAVALFAALSYAVTNSGRGGGDIRTEQVAIDMAQVQQYGAVIAQSLMRMRTIGDCDETDISFENPHVTAYSNAGAPDSCKVFHQDGGAVNWQDPPASVWANEGTGFHHESYAFMSGVDIPGVGGTDEELFMTFYVGEDASLCREINKAVKVGNTIPVATDYCFGPFVGSYDPAGACANTTWTNLNGITSACVQHAPGSEIYYYYQVIMPR
tara:strand:- start:9375 stop:10046 length:672 start_codon:yes stop_codon:yes gene_type:complete